MIRTTIEPFRIRVSLRRLVSPHRFRGVSMDSSAGVGPGAGVTPTTVTGPITHQSPVMNWPAGY